MNPVGIAKRPKDSLKDEAQVSTLFTVLGVRMWAYLVRGCEQAFLWTNMYWYILKRGGPAVERLLVPTGPILCTAR